MDVEATIRSITDKLTLLSKDLDCAVACVSGGVDSVVSAVLAKRVFGDKVIPVFIDTGFMRLNESNNVVKTLKGILEVEVYDFSNLFIGSLEGLSDAEEKRRVFRDLFYRAIRMILDEKKCSWIIQGTIKADVIETIKGVKTQHNVLNREFLEKYGFKVIEPILDLYKHEVRLIAEHLGLPKAIINRQPFPGPGLLIRVVGRFERRKLEIVRELTHIVEKELSGKGFNQFFPAIWDYNIIETSSINGIEYGVFEVKVTGVVNYTRTYGHPVIVNKWPEDANPFELYRRFNAIKHPHVLIKLFERNYGLYLVALRIVKTTDFMTAEVPRLNLSELELIINRVVALPEVKTVALDITPKPPATIEYE